jgi:hypothetical protein
MPEGEWVSFKSSLDKKVAEGTLLSVECAGEWLEAHGFFEGFLSAFSAPISLEQQIVYEDDTDELFTFDPKRAKQWAVSAKRLRGERLVRLPEGQWILCWNRQGRTHFTDLTPEDATDWFLARGVPLLPAELQSIAHSKDLTSGSLPAPNASDVPKTLDPVEDFAQAPPASARSESDPPLPVRPIQAKTSHRMSVDEANEVAMRLAKKMKRNFFRLSERNQAKQIGCSWQTWRKTEFYKTARRKKNRQTHQTGQGKVSAPRSVVSLTHDLEAVTGEGERDEVLKQLTAEQLADQEPSPLDSDPPDCQPRKVFSRKRL